MRRSHRGGDMGFDNPYTKEEIRLIRGEAFTNDELADMFGRSELDIMRKRKKLRERKRMGTPPVYTEEQIQMIRDKKYTDDELGAMFGKSRKAIAAKRYDLKRKNRGDRNRNPFDYVDTNEL